MHARFRIVLLLLGLAPAECLAQDIGGNLEGAVTDSTGQPLAGVDVLVDGTGLPGARITQTNTLGHFRLDRLPVGSYRARYRLVGYRPAALTGLVVRIGRTTSVPTLTLTRSTFTLEEITVAVERPLLDPTSAAGGGTLTADHFGDLPTDRNYRSLPVFLPGVTDEVDGFNIEGATALENQFYVDGANVTDMGGGSITSALLPPNFVQEVRVRSGGYEAEYRGALGGTVDVVTRSGGERMEGQLFGTATGNGLTGAPRTVELGTSAGGFSRYDAGGSLGGPITRGRLWFFGAYSRFTEREATVVPGYESPDSRRIHHSFAAKLTWQPGMRTTVITSFLGDPTTERTVGGWSGGLANLDPLLGAARTGFLTGTINVAHAASTRLAVNVSASWVRQRYHVTAATERGRTELWFADTNDVLSGGYFAQGGSHDTRLTGVLSASYVAGAHQLKAGVEYVNQRLDQTYLELHGYHNRPGLDRPTDYYQLETYDVQGLTQSRLPSVYVQDAWGHDGHVTFNAGLRWDGQYLIGSDGHISLAIKDQWQPRLGMVLRPDADGRQRVFLSWGRFYQEIHQTLGSVYYAYGSRFGRADCTSDPRVDSSTCGPPMQIFSRVPDPGLEGQSFDEWSAGYERALTGRLTARVRLVGRRFNWAIEDSRLHNDGDIVVGNPGRGELSDYPKPQRDYTGLELSVEGALTPRLWVLTSYVLSRTYGNFTGLYNSDEGYISPNVNGAFDNQDILVNGTGLLPNDRPHVFKLNAAYRWPAGITAGTAFVLQSGIPRNILAPIVTRPWRNEFTVRRGTAGRTPTVWDLNLRLAWSAAAILRQAWEPSIVLDLYHVASGRQVLAYDELTYLGVDEAGNLTSPNPNYGKPTRFQPPMAARLGIAVSF
jgi:hypothetical protein